jgi:hypothetical protein
VSEYMSKRFCDGKDFFGLCPAPVRHSIRRREYYILAAVYVVEFLKSEQDFFSQEETTPENG